MIDLIAQADLAIGSSKGAASAAPLIPAAASDADRFRALMDTPAAAASVSQPPTASDLGRPLAVGSGSNAPSLGQTILSTMQDLSTDTRARFAKAEEVMAKPDLSMSDLLSLQFMLLQTSVQFEIASKGISKFTQNVDSILKTQ